MLKKAIIEIKDEVNCRIIGLDPTDRRALSKKFEYEIPGARYLPSVRLGRWSGKVSYFSVGGASYINLLPEIIPIIDAAGYDIEIDDVRSYSTSFEFKPITENSFSHISWPEKHSLAGKPIELRDYQVEIVNNFLKNPQCIQVAPTGAGKTLITAALSSSVEHHGRSIVIVPNKSLVTQTEADYINLGLDVGVYYGDRKELGKKHTICTWQSVLAIIKNTQNGEATYTIHEFLENVVSIIIDECFDGDSPVLTPFGFIPIKMLKPGDKIINYSESTGNFKEDIIVHTHKNLTKSFSEKMYELEFDNGKKIKVTGNHKFLTNTGWIRADELNENHEIVSSNINTSN
jgi:hypothetical protein